MQQAHRLASLYTLRHHAGFKRSISIGHTHPCNLHYASLAERGLSHEAAHSHCSVFEQCHADSAMLPWCAMLTVPYCAMLTVPYYIRIYQCTVHTPLMQYAHGAVRLA